MPVYFVQSGDNGPVKIGYARDPRKRLAFLQTGCPDVLRLVRVIAGNRQVETEAHAHFKADRLRGEWFAFNPEMLTYGQGAADGAEAESNVMRYFHPLIEEFLREGRYRQGAIFKWRKRGVPYEVCCHAADYGRKRGMDIPVDVQTLRQPLARAAA